MAQEDVGVIVSGRLTPSTRPNEKLAKLKGGHVCYRPDWKLWKALEQYESAWMEIGKSLV